MNKIALPRKYKVEELIDKFMNEIHEFKGSKNIQVIQVTSLNQPINQSIIWIGSEFFEKQISTISNLENCLIITDYPNKFQGVSKNAVIVANKPKLMFIKILNHIFKVEKQSFIHKSAVIDNRAIIGENVQIDANVVIGNVKIGNNCTIESNVTIYDNTEIGNNVIIQAGAVIGSKGMSLSRDENGELFGFPCLGKVIIEDSVEIGSNCVIDQSILEETRIGKGSKINSLTFIGNSVFIGENNYVSVMVNINGSVKIGNSNFIGSGSTIRNKVTIGSENTIGAGSVVLKIIENEKTVVGNPAITKDYLKNLKL